MPLLCSSRINKDYLILVTIARLRVPQIVISGSENGVKTWHRHAKTVQVMENRIPDSERRQNFLSGGIQHIHRVTYQCFILKFKYHVKCKNFRKKSVSPPYIINRNSFLYHHLATVALLLLDEKRYEDNFSCRMIPD